MSTQTRSADPDLFDPRYLGPLEVEVLALGVVTDLDRAPDLVGVARIEQHAVRPGFERLERRPGLLGRLDARHEVGLLADARDEVLERDDGPVLADDEGIIGLARCGLGERLVVLVEHSDVRAVGVAAAHGREIRRPRVVGRQVGRAVALAALPDDLRVGSLAVVDGVDAAAVHERRDRHRAEVADLRDVALVTEHPVDAGFEPRGDPFFPVLPVAHRVVGFEPDRTCHTGRSEASGLNVAETPEGFRAVRSSPPDPRHRTPRRCCSTWTRSTRSA